MVRSHPIAVRLEAELEEVVRKQADVWHVSISQAIRNMVYAYFEEPNQSSTSTEENVERWTRREVTELFGGHLRWMELENRLVSGKARIVDLSEKR